MLTGTVDIQVAPFPGGGPCNAAALPGDLLICGDPQGNRLLITDNGGGSYTITRPAGDNTNFTINGANVGPAQTVTGITGNFVIELGNGTDQLTLQDVNLPAAGPPIPSNTGNLVINSRDGGDDQYVLSGTFVSAEVYLSVTSGGRNQLVIEGSATRKSTVVGGTFVANPGGGGSHVRVVDSDLRGDIFAFGVPAAVALPHAPFVGNGLQLRDGAGQNKVEVLGNSIIGGGANPPNAGQNAVFLDNGAGGSDVTFGPAQAGSGNRVQVFGGVLIQNGTNAVGEVDLVTISATDVTGGVGIDHLAGPGTTLTTIMNSNLGTDISAPGTGPGPVPAGGFPVEIVSENGMDSIVMTQSTAPWGVFVNNDAVAGGLSGPGLTGGGGTVSVTNSAIGNRPGGPGSPVRFAPRFPLTGGFGTTGLAPFDALFVSGDNGNDVVTVNGLRSLGNVNINVFNGENDVTVAGDPSAISALASLSIIGGIGTDRVTISNLSSPAATYIELGFGSDRLTLVGQVTFAASPTVGTLQIFTGTPGSPGAGANDTLDISGITTLIPNPLFGLDLGFDIIIT